MSRSAKFSAVAVLAVLPLMISTQSAVAVVAPGVPTGVHVLAVTGLRSPSGRGPPRTPPVTLYLSSTRSDVYSVNLARAHRSATTRTPRMTVGGLAYTSKPYYYYRVVALNGSKRRLDPVIHFVGLRPATPSGVHAISSSAGTYLSWSAADGDRLHR